MSEGLETKKDTFYYSLFLLVVNLMKYFSILSFQYELWLYLCSVQKIKSMLIMKNYPIDHSKKPSFGLNQKTD